MRNFMSMVYIESPYFDLKLFKFVYELNETKIPNGISISSYGIHPQMSITCWEYINLKPIEFGMEQH